jgi:hypothetical protein
MQNTRYYMPINIATTDKEIIECDSKSYIALQCMRYIKGRTNADFIGMMQALDSTRNTLYFGNSANAALFLARSLALISNDVRKKLQTFNHEVESVLKNPERFCQEINLSDAFKHKR